MSLGPLRFLQQFKHCLLNNQYLCQVNTLTLEPAIIISMSRAIITGITGQDGIFLTKLLTQKNYEVLGLTSSLHSPKSEKFRSLFPSVALEKFLPSDIYELQIKINSFRPTEIYNLAAISSVSQAEQNPEVAHKINFKLPMNLIKILDNLKKQNSIKLYQASSSEMFGNSSELMLTEKSDFNPISAYAKSKLAAHQYCLDHRKKGIFVACGIMFNHESEYREEKFLSKKICRGVAEIILGKSEKIVVGNLNPRRDWGYAADYTHAMWSMLQRDTPEDFVIATGKSRSIEMFIQTTLDIAGLSGDLFKYISQDQALFRKNEIQHTVGDASRARTLLEWAPSTTFEAMIKKMIDFEITNIKKEF